MEHVHVGHTCHKLTTHIVIVHRSFIVIALDRCLENLEEDLPRL